MPVCYITVSNKIGSKEEMQDKVDSIRDIVADGLDSKSRLLDRFHIAVRIQEADRAFMLSDIELDIYAQFFLRRFFSRDTRANKISHAISNLMGVDCATWINLCQVGYSRFTVDGNSYFSVKEDDHTILERRKHIQIEE